MASNHRERGITVFQVLVVARARDLDALDAKPLEDVEAVLEGKLKQCIGHDADLHGLCSWLVMLN
jgi:hypothetical protein